MNYYDEDFEELKEIYESNQWIYDPETEDWYKSKIINHR